LKSGNLGIAFVGKICELNGKMTWGTFIDQSKIPNIKKKEYAQTSLPADAFPFIAHAAGAGLGFV
jgi:hypothetical protein